MSAVAMDNLATPLAYALAYARLGWKVLPLEPQTKRPHRIAPRGLYSATSDAKTLREMWTAAPDAGIGVACRESGLAVLDIDPRNGGLLTLERLEAQHGPISSDVQAITPGGGLHLFYAAPSADMLLPGTLGPGIDVKWAGYVCVEPSVHPNGKTYGWEASSSPLDGARPSPLPPLLGAVSGAPAARLDGQDRYVPISELQWGELYSALRKVSADERETWIRVGMALHSTGEPDRAFQLWCEWSQSSSKYDPRDQMRVWRSFRGRGLDGVTYRAIFALAQPDESIAIDEAMKQSAPAAEDKLPRATPYEYTPPSSIPPRKWIYGRHYIRKFLTATIAPGGTGKSSLVLVEQISMAIGRDLLRNGEPIKGGPYRVWFYAMEDPVEEIDRRVAAILVHYGIDPAELGGRFFRDSARDRPLVVAVEHKGSLIAVPKMREAIDAEIRRNGIDVLTLDPYVSTHRVSENDNSKQDAIAQIWKQISDDRDCSIELIHHVRKGNGAEVSADDMRGAVSLKDACRSVRAIANMTEEEARGYQVELDRRRFYLYLKDAKANLVAPIDRREWFHLASVDLGNGDAIHDSDKVGVIEPWAPPDALDGVSVEHLSRICAALRQMTDEQRIENAAVRQNTPRWFGILVGQIVGRDVNRKEEASVVLRMIRTWEQAGVLEQSVVHDKKKGRQAPVYRLGKAAI